MGVELNVSAQLKIWDQFVRSPLKLLFDQYGELKRYCYGFVSYHRKQTKKNTVSWLWLTSLTKCTYSTSRKRLVDSSPLSAVSVVLTIVAKNNWLAFLTSSSWSKRVAQLGRRCEKLQKFLPSFPEVICISKEVSLDQRSVADVTTRFLNSCIFFNFCLVWKIAPSRIKSSGPLWFPPRITYIGIWRPNDCDFFASELLNKVSTHRCLSECWEPGAQCNSLQF